VISPHRPNDQRAWFGFPHVWANCTAEAGSVRKFLKGFGMEVVVTIESSMRRPSAPVIVFLLTLASTVATVHAAENPRKITVVSFGLFGDEGVF
jgi:hypothetical protein